MTRKKRDLRNYFFACASSFALGTFKGKFGCVVPYFLAAFLRAVPIEAFLSFLRTFSFLVADAISSLSFDVFVRTREYRRKDLDLQLEFA